MRTASDFVPGSTAGNLTETEIAASTSVVWYAMENLRFDELKVTNVLMGVRSLPARLTRRGALRSGSDEASPPVLEALASGRFIELYREPEALITLGVIGQFWKLAGGDDAEVTDPQAFVSFDRPGFVKAAIDFALTTTDRGTQLTTTTCNRATDPDSERRFSWYWRLIGPGSKLIRIDMLRAVRRRAESSGG